MGYDDEFDSEAEDDEENLDEEVAFIRCVNKYFHKVELNETAVKKHLYPTCNSDLDAIKFSERKKRRRTLTNTVIKAKPSEFHLTLSNIGSVKKYHTKENLKSGIKEK